MGSPWAAARSGSRRIAERCVLTGPLLAAFTTLACGSTPDDTRIYSVGYLLGEFIVNRGGPGALRALVVSNGDTQAVLGLSTAAFEQQAAAFVRARYF